MFKWLRKLIGKKEPEKLRIRISGNKVILVSIPAEYENNYFWRAALQQRIACYEYKLRGEVPLNLGGFGGLGRLGNLSELGQRSSLDV